jgi:hypothetical protein
MSDTTTQTIQENQTATGTLGTPLSIILKGEDNVPAPGPGMVVMEAYDPAYLKVLQCGWYPPGELVGDSADFRVIFMPLQTGNTKVKFTIQPRAINPLFQPVTFSVTINS